MSDLGASGMQNLGESENTDIGLANSYRDGQKVEDLAIEQQESKSPAKEEDKEEEVEFDQQVENSSYVSQDFLRQRMDRSESNPFAGEIRRDAQPSMSSNPYK